MKVSKGKALAEMILRGEFVCDNWYCLGTRYWVRHDGVRVCAVCHPKPVQR